MSKTRYHCYAGLSASVLILLFIGFVVLLVWLSLLPKPPRFTIVAFTIPKSDLDNGGKKGSLEYCLEVKHNSGSVILYDDILLAFYDGQGRVGENTIPAFHQGPNTRTRGNTIRVVDHVEVVDQHIWMALRNSILNGTAELKVVLQTQIRYRSWGKMSKQHLVNSQAVLKIGPDGKISGKKKKIKLRRRRSE